MRRQLSSKTTFLLKVILPGLLIFNCIGAPFAIFFGSGESLSPVKNAIFSFTIFFFILAIACLLVKRFKVVSVDDKFLHVSNYLKEISIPASDVRDITEIVWVRGHPITIHLKTI